jgi:membrane protein required for colicin V production
MASLTALDVVVLLLIGLGGLAGLARGFVTEILSLFAWVAALFAVHFIYPFARPLAVHLTGTSAGGSILAFAGIFIIAFLIFRSVAQQLGSRTRNSIIGPFDRLLGLGFGLFKGLIGAAVIYLVLGFGYDVIDAGGLRPAWIESGRTKPLLELTSKTMVEFVEARTNRIDLIKPGTASDTGTADKPRHEPKSQHDKARPDKGYDPAQRGALDRLLDRAGGKS